MSKSLFLFKVVVHVDETTPVRGVILTFFGKMTIYWKTVDGGGTQEFCEIEDYLDEKVNNAIKMSLKLSWLFDKFDISHD